MEWSDLTTYPKEIKLNLGGRRCFDGRGHFSGWISVDRRCGKYNGGRCNIQHVFPNQMPIESETVDAILSEHFLEHITADDVQEVLDDCQRVLKTGCVARIALPDVNHPLHEDNRINNRDPMRGHNSVWCVKSMTAAMLEAGFSRVVPRSYWIHSGGESGNEAGYQHVHRAMDDRDGWVRRTIGNDGRNFEQRPWGELWATSLIVDGIK
tara:strand:- start:4039 stop:4665 length:627 start_codon:yes stop_codon:yes gene_type:complete